MRPATPPSGRHSSKEIDIMLGRLHGALRCLCCPTRGLFTSFVEAEGRSQPAKPDARVLTRADFIGLLAPHQIDDGLS